MLAPWITPFVVALSVLTGLEVVYLVLRRVLSGLYERIRFQVWILSATLVALYSFSDGERLLPRNLDASVLAGAAFLTILLSFDLAYLFFDRLFLSKRVGPTGRPSIPRLVRDLGSWIAVFLGLVIGGSWFLGFDFRALALSSAAATAALGFAMQDVLKNLFAGIALQTEQPFDLGDWVEVDGSARQVTEMSWRSTQMRDNLGVEYREPNANLATARITRLGSGRTPTGFAVRVGLAYGSPPARVKESLVRAARDAEGVLEEPPPQALLVGFGESAVDYELRYWTREVRSVARVRDAVLSRVWYRLHRDGWIIPFPIRTVQVEATQRIERDKGTWRQTRADELLASIDLFESLDDARRSRLAAAARQLYFDGGERLVVEGEPGDSLFLVSRGAVVVSKRADPERAVANAREVRLARLEEGSSFGEMSLLTGEPRSATVTAEGAVEVFELDREAMAPILAEDPTIAETLSKLLAKRTAETAARLEDRQLTERSAGAGDPHSLLHRIRGFFKLNPRT